MQKRSEVNIKQVGDVGMGKPNGGNTKRRALGDITNAVRQEDPKENVAKKPVLLVNAQPIRASNTSISSMLISDSNSENRISEDDERAYMQRPSDNIDARDAGNPLLVTEYVDPMYEHFREMEKTFLVDARYMTTQQHINDKMRAILVDWLVEVHMKFKMVPETLYTTINFIDRFLAIKEVRRSRLQLSGVACLLLASKYEEIYPPELKELVYITDRAYNKEEILQMELEVVGTLNYNCTIPTAHTFLCRYLKAAHADRTMVQLACYLAERSLQEITSLQFLPSTIAATSILIARKTLKRHPWSPTLLKYTGLDECDLQACVDDMKKFLDNNESSQQQAVYRKYSGPKFGAVAKLDLVY